MNKLNQYKSLFFLLSLYIWLLPFLGCRSNSNNEAFSDLSARDKMYFEQYMVQGQQLYKARCSNCHQDNGRGLGRLIPPLDSADYLLNNMSRSACVIKYGLEGSILVNNVEYNQPMGPQQDLTDIEIAQILTYIGNSWSNSAGFYPVKQVSQFLNNCK